LFNSKTWFDKHEGDRAIERDLYPEEIANQDDFDDNKQRTRKHFRKNNIVVLLQ
jgi:hypothetical protein